MVEPVATGYKNRANNESGFENNAFDNGVYEAIRATKIKE